jgi:hypothetical protein
VTGVFKRRKKSADDDAELQQPAAADDGTDHDEGAGSEPEDAEPAPPVRPGRPQGPWDEADSPEDGVQRLDLGGLRVPVPPQTEVRVDVSPEGEVVAATMVQGGSAMQVSAFAAPRTEGIWDDVRSEIEQALTGSGGSAVTAEGPWGPELHAEVPTQVPGQSQVVLAPARFVGVDGPRWFLRALLTGPAARDREVAAGLEAALRQVVVVRGADPMAVRDALPLRLPKEVTEQAAAEAAAAGEDTGAPRSLPAPQRGPEITEMR